MLNDAWSRVAVVGKWISFDEQMVRCVHRTAKFMQWHMPNKPIKNGERPVGLEINCAVATCAGDSAGPNEIKAVLGLSKYYYIDTNEKEKKRARQE